MIYLVNKKSSLIFVKTIIALVFTSLSYSYALIAEEYKVAVRAHGGIEKAIQQWQPTIEALNKALPDHDFSLLPIVKINEITERAGKGEFHFVLTNPSSYVELNELYDAKALVTLNNKRVNTAQSRFGSVIFTHAKSSEIISLSSMKDKSLMAVSEPAFGGWRVAWLEMLRQEFDPYRDLKLVSFTESRTQPEVVMAVLEGKVDIGVVRTDLLERMEADGKIDMRFLRVINNQDIKEFPFFLSTALYPEWPLAALSTVQSEHIEQVKNALIDITENSKAAVAGSYVGWITPLDYTSVKDLMKTLQVGPYKQ